MVIHMLYARPVVAASDLHAGWTKDYTVMLTLVINGMTGLIAALVIASLIQSARAFLPAWQKLSAEVARLEQGSVLHVSLREVGPTDMARMAAQLDEQPAMMPVILTTPQPLIRQPRRAFPSPARHAAA